MLVLFVITFALKKMAFAVYCVNIHLSEIPASDSNGVVSHTHPAQVTEWVLQDANSAYKYTSNGKPVKFVVGMNGLLADNNPVNDGTLGDRIFNGKPAEDPYQNYYWAVSDLRNMLNTTFRNAIPSSIRSIFKQFKVPSYGYYDSDVINWTDDYFTIPAQNEVDGMGGGSDRIINQLEADVTPQLEWYKTREHWIKHMYDSRYNGSEAISQSFLYRSMIKHSLGPYVDDDHTRLWCVRYVKYGSSYDLSNMGGTSTVYGEISYLTPFGVI